MTPNTIIYILLFIIFLLIIFLIISIVLYSKKPCISVCEDCPSGPAGCEDCPSGPAGCEDCIFSCSGPSFIGVGNISNGLNSILYVPNKNVNSGSSIFNFNDVKFISKNNNNVNFLVIDGNNNLYKINTSCVKDCTVTKLLNMSKFISVLQRFDDDENSKKKFLGIGTDNKLYEFNLDDTSPNVIPEINNVKYITKGGDNIVYFINDVNILYTLTSDNNYTQVNSSNAYFISVIHVEEQKFIGIGTNTYLYTFEINNNNIIININLLKDKYNVKYITKADDNTVYLLSKTNNGFYILNLNNNEVLGPYVKDNNFINIIQI
jgi:hypothetical protein